MCKLEYCFDVNETDRLSLGYSEDYLLTIINYFIFPFDAMQCVAMCFSSALGSPTETREGKQLLLVPLDAMGAYSSHPELPYNFPVPIEAEEYQGRSAASGT